MLAALRLMDVKTPREINLAFLSLIKLFSEVKVEQKSISLNPKPRLPSSINAGSAQQVNLLYLRPVCLAVCKRLVSVNL